MSENNKTENQEPQKDYLMPDDREKMDDVPQVESDSYKPAGKMKGMNTLITGADSGIGRAIAIAFAKEGANVAIIDLEENEDTDTIMKRLEELGVKALLYTGDVGDEAFVKETVKRLAEDWGEIDVLVNNAAEQHPQESIMDIDASQIDRTFRTNVFGLIYLSREAFPHMAENGSIINTTSVTAYEGSAGLIDYSATKGAIVSFTRSLSQNKEILDKNIRVNAVAPGPIWTPLIAATVGASLDDFGGGPLGRAGQPYELAPAYVYLATADSSYVTGQTIHVNGGTIVNG